MKMIKFDKIELNFCPKCEGERLSIRYSQGRTKMKVPYFHGTVKCKKCAYFVESSNPQKLIKRFGQKLPEAIN